MYLQCATIDTVYADARNSFYGLSDCWMTVNACANAHIGIREYSKLMASLPVASFRKLNFRYRNERAQNVKIISFEYCCFA